MSKRKKDSVREEEAVAEQEENTGDADLQQPQQLRHVENRTTIGGEREPDQDGTVESSSNNCNENPKLKKATSSTRPPPGRTSWKLWNQMGITHLILGLPLALILYIYYNNTAATTSSSRHSSSEPGPIVNISNGAVQGGHAGLSRDGREFYEFLGIPYAEPPVKNLRFKPPAPAQPWTGIRAATTYGSQCTQIEFFTGKLLGSEDCLFLNVFTPKLGPENKLPVMVFIHGGYFMSGSSNTYRPSYFMDQDIVLVTLNYRLGSLGFLNTGDNVIRGNMGLKDQVAALKWVKENIAQFGGDPQRVTIFGPSAGGAAVHYHTLSPLSKGLFHKAISQSGSAIKVWSFVENPQEQAKRLGKKLNCPTETTSKLIHCLRSLDANQIVLTQREYLDVLLDPLAIYAPTIESVTDGSTFLPEHPYSILAQGKENRLPWLTGLNSEEGLLFSARILKNSQLTTKLNSNFEETLPALLGYSQHPNKEEITKKAREFYFGSEIVPDFVRHFTNYTNMLSDRLYFTASHEAILLQSRNSPVFIYYYTYPARFSFTHILELSGTFPPALELIARFLWRWISQNVFQRPLPNLGICHGDELVMLFDLGVISNIQSTDREYTMSKKMVQLWTDFASSSTDGAPLTVDQIIWTPLPAYPAQLNYLNLDESAKIIQEPFTTRVHFWKSLGLL